MHGPHLSNLYYCKRSEALSERMWQRWRWGPKALPSKHWASAGYRRRPRGKRPASGCPPDPARSVPGLLGPVPASRGRPAPPPSASRAARRLPAAGRGRRGAGRRFRARRRAPLAPRAAPPWPRRGTRCRRVSSDGADGTGAGRAGAGAGGPPAAAPCPCGRSASPRALRAAERGSGRAVPCPEPGTAALRSPEGSPARRGLKKQKVQGLSAAPFPPRTLIKLGNNFSWAALV